MFKIDNLPLPQPQGLELGYLPRGDGTLRLRVSASYAGLDAAGLGVLLQAGQGSFTLSLFDPMAGAERGFQATLSSCKLSVREAAQGLPVRSALTMVMEETL